MGSTMNRNLPPGTSGKEIDPTERCSRCGEDAPNPVIIDNGESLPDSVLCPDCALELD
jgi:rubredoxin